MTDAATTELQRRLAADEPILLEEGSTLTLGTNTYSVIEYVARGGSGEVYKADWAGQTLALKVFFPFYAMEQAEQLGLFDQPDVLESLTTRFSFTDREEEYASLSEISHPYIVDVLASGDITRTAREPDLFPSLVRVPVLARRWVEGLALLEAIDAFDLDDRAITNALLGLARALGYLHDSLEFMHCDIKPANVLISASSQESILIDFALYKNFSDRAPQKQEPTTFVCDWNYFPSLRDQDPLQKMLKRREGTRAELRKHAFPHLDLFQFGRLLEKVIEAHSERFPPNELEYLGLLATQLTDWSRVRTWTSADLIDRIGRLGAERMTPFGVEELGAPSSAERTIVLPPGTDVPCTPLVYNVINTRAFRRLERIKQLSLIDFVYPGAGYTRDLHLLYSYELTRRLILTLYHEPLFRMHFDSRSVRQLLVVALIHDLNHFPFLHQIQELDLPGLADIDLLAHYCRLDAKETKRERDAETNLPKTLLELLADVGLDDQQRLARLIFGVPHEQDSPHVEVDQIISSIVNSGVDIDKLSYLFYDSYFTGVRFGQGIDVSAVLKGATIGRVPKEDAIQMPLHLAFTDRAFQALENVVLTRFWNFRAIYWHHTNRALMAMLLHVFRALYSPRADGSKPLEVTQYIDATAWHSDDEAVRYLDQQYTKVFHEPSVLRGLLENRRMLYKRLYTVRAGGQERSENDLFNDLHELVRTRQQSTFEKELAKALRVLLGRWGCEMEVRPHDVLLDVPNRDPAKRGFVYLREGDALVNLAARSTPVAHLRENYRGLAQRARVFVSPRLAAVVGERRLSRRDEIRAIVSECVQLTKRRESQLQ